MLTRLEVDGFKNLLDFKVDFGPFNCIAGPNGVGKSNIFDAIRFLSLLADHTLMDAALQIRETAPETADLRDLFWAGGQDTEIPTLRIAAEMLVNPEVFDDFGRHAEASSTYLRYELKIGYEAPEHRGRLGRLVLLFESLDYIKKEEAARRLTFPHSARLFRNAIVYNRRRGSGYISTAPEGDGHIAIHIHQDGGSSGQPQKASAIRAPRTIVGTSNTSTTPTILAARREMQSWKFLALEPSAMRGADRFDTPPHITSEGDQLPATLYRLAMSAGNEEDAERVYARIVARLAHLVPVRGLRVDVEEVRQLLTLEVQEASGTTFPARSLSDGTLRFLTLAVLGEDPEGQRLVCMEEPENGIHPAKMEAMVRLLKDIAVNPMLAPGSDNPLRQVIIATHSPVLVQLLEEDDLLLALGTMIKGSDGKPVRTLRCRPLLGTWRDRDKKGEGKGSILAYLTAPENASIQLDFHQL